MTRTTRFKETLRRRLCVGAPRLLAVMLAAACLLGVLWGTSLFMRVVTLTVSNDSAAPQTLYLPVASLPFALRVAGIDTLPEDDVSLTERGDGFATLHIERSFAIRVTADGKTQEHRTIPCTVKEALTRMDIAVHADDFSQPALHETVTSDTGAITLHRVQYREYAVDNVLPYETETQYTSLFYQRRDRVLTLQEGQNGFFRGVLRDKLVDGAVVQTVPLETLEHTPPTTEILKQYKEGVPISAVAAPAGITVENGVPSSYTTLYEMKATGYFAKRGKGSSGLGLYYGTFAVDPTLIPYGTKVYIVSQNGKFVYGWAIATDTGAFIHSTRLQVDLFYETYAESAINGVQQVYVYVP